MKRQRARTLIQLVIASVVALSMVAAFFAVGGLGSGRNVLAQTGPGNSSFIQPGWGCGDTNHSHTGPPGLIKKASRVSGFTLTSPCSRSTSSAAAVSSTAGTLASPAGSTSSTGGKKGHKGAHSKSKTHKSKTHKGKGKKGGHS